MFLDSFPLQTPENRAVRPLREPAPVEAAKSRSAWPFIVADKDFVLPRARETTGAAALPVSISPVSSSFVT
jgi:hypothetical protein